VSPSTGPSVGGNTVTISGQCFASATQVLFGATPARSFTVNADGTRIQAVAPAGRGTVDITVVGAGECGNAVLADGYGYTGAAVGPTGPTGPTGPSIPGMPATGVEVFGALTFAALLLLAGGLLVFARRRRSAQHDGPVGAGASGSDQDGADQVGANQASSGQHRGGDGGN
jgi:LPXTG-motif cell wall-anchored protein